MNLLQLRTEVLAHGFDPVQYGARINTYLNDAANLVARRVDYYVDDTTSTFATVAGTDTYAWPADLARARSLFDTDRHVEMQYAGVRDMDRSPAVQGAPAYYALTGMSIRLYPVPNGVYNLELRYWKMPTQMQNDTDSPSLPADWHSMLWAYAVGQCYAADDDPQTAQYWQQQFNTSLSMFAADQKFPDSDGPSQARGMWDEQPVLGWRGGSW